MAEKSGQSPNRTNAMLAWLIAPITSFIFMNDEDAFTKRCAKHSLYFGLVDVAIHLGLWIVGAVLSLIVVGVCCYVIWIGWVFVSIGVRIIGAVKANQGELFEVPVISGLIKE